MSRGPCWQTSPCRFASQRRPARTPATVSRGLAYPPQRLPLRTRDRLAVNKLRVYRADRRELPGCLVESGALVSNGAAPQVSKCFEILEQIRHRQRRSELARRRADATQVRLRCSIVDWRLFHKK